jgi:hypothetical protein
MALPLTELRRKRRNGLPIVWAKPGTSGSKATLAYSSFESSTVILGLIFSDAPSGGADGRI